MCPRPGAQCRGWGGWHWKGPHQHVGPSAPHFWPSIPCCLALPGPHLGDPHLGLLQILTWSPGPCTPDPAHSSMKASQGWFPLPPSTPPAAPPWMLPWVPSAGCPLCLSMLGTTPHHPRCPHSGSCFAVHLEPGFTLGSLRLYPPASQCPTGWSDSGSNSPHPWTP